MTDESFESRLDRIEGLVEANSQQISRIERALNGLIEVVGLTAGQLNQLTERVDSLAAASERYDRILDYLLRRDGHLPE